MTNYHAITYFKYHSALIIIFKQEQLRKILIKKKNIYIILYKTEYYMQASMQ